MKARKIPGYEEATRADEGAVAAERRERIAALLLVRTKLSEAEAALFREVFPEIFAAHYRRLWGVIQREGVREADVKDELQEVFACFADDVLASGLPESIPAKLTALADGKARNQRRADKRSPITLGSPSSGSEPACSGRHVDSELDRLELVRRVLPALSENDRKVIQLVILEDLTQAEAAARLGLPLSTLKTRLVAALKRLKVMVAPFVPESER